MITDLRELSNSESISALQTFDIHILHYQLQMPSVHTWFYVNKTNIRSAKSQDSLSVNSIGCNQDPAEGFSGNTVVIFEQR